MARERGAFTPGLDAIPKMSRFVVQALAWDLAAESTLKGVLRTFSSFAGETPGFMRTRNPKLKI
jgi:hypothetical protein